MRFSTVAATTLIATAAAAPAAAPADPISSGVNGIVGSGTSIPASIAKGDASGVAKEIQDIVAASLSIPKGLLGSGKALEKRQDVASGVSDITSNALNIPKAILGGDGSGAASAIQNIIQAALGLGKSASGAAAAKGSTAAAKLSSRQLGDNVASITSNALDIPKAVLSGNGNGLAAAIQGIIDSALKID